jgi:Secretion system C-terminal sorting domain
MKAIVIKSIFALILLCINLPAQVIFTDNFESGFADLAWDIYFADEDTLTAIDMASTPDPLPTGGNYAGYLQDIDASNTGVAMAIAGGIDLYDYSIEGNVYCYVYHFSGLSAYTGLVVYADSTIGTYIKMVADFDNNQRIRLYNNHVDFGTGQYTFEYNFGASDIPGGIPTIDSWHKMKVEVRTINSDTTAFWCYFDDQLLAGCPIYDTSEDRIGAGQFGVFSFQQDDDGIGGFFDNINVISLISSVEEMPLSSTPSSISLKQNYPNPFNPSTTIEFGIPESQFVILAVYNLLGEQVGLLVNEYLSAGSYKATWDASDLPSGIYIYKLSAGEFSQSNKMILLR